MRPLPGSLWSMKMTVCENLHRIARELIMMWSGKWRIRLFELDSSESGETYDAEVTALTVGGSSFGET